MRRPRDELVARISAERARLAELQEREERTKERLSDLESQLARLDPSNPNTDHGRTDPPIPGTATGKVTLFRSLFRGRPDVFPTRFVSKKTGKAGYAQSMDRLTVLVYGVALAEAPELLVAGGLHPEEDPRQLKRLATGLEHWPVCGPSLGSRHVRHRGLAARLCGDSRP